MPSIFIMMRQGRTLEEKRALVANVTRTVVETLEVSPDVVRIQLIEQKDENQARGGVLLTDME